MTDLVRALRYWGDPAQPVISYYAPLKGIMLEAADEIERLRAGGDEQLRIAASAVVRWADDLRLYADEGTSLVPALQGLKDALMGGERGREQTPIEDNPAITSTRYSRT